MKNPEDNCAKPLVVTPGQGREYDMGRMKAVFVADGEETANRYSISEWSLEPRTPGPGAHAHDDDHIFHVLTGTLILYIEGRKHPAPAGSYAVVPGGVSHDFENEGLDVCKFVSINVPAGFEKMMPQLVSWFEKNPLEPSA